MLHVCVFLILNTALVQAGMEGFIVGGAFSQIQRNPHSAFLSISCIAAPYGLESMFVCGSSVMNQLLLLTAAHCLQTCMMNTRITIHVGNKNKLKGIVRYAAGYVIHQNYDPYTITNDIAMIKMTAAVPLSKVVSRVAIMSSPPYNEPARVAGWGMINERTQQYGNELKELDQTIYSRQTCIRQFGYETLPPGIICGTTNRNHEFASSGDSGSALVVRGFIQIGVVSFKNMMIAPHVSIYTDVGYHYDWVTTMARNMYCTNQF